MTQYEWTSNAISSIKDVLKDEHDIVANYLFPVVSPLFLIIGAISAYRGDMDSAKFGLEVGGGTGGYSILSKLYEKMSR